MVTRALEKYLRISPKKMRPIARLIKEKKVEDALYILMNTNKKGASILKRVLESAFFNAKRLPEKNFAEEDLYISRVMVDGGPALKRYRSMSMGRAGLIRKRTSHVLVELDAPRKEVAQASKGRRKPEKKPVKTKKIAKKRK